MDRREQLAQAGRWLRLMREQRDMSARDFANAIDVATQAVYNWESGKNAVTDERADRIAELFGVDVIEVRRNLGLWIPPERAPGAVESADDRLDRLYAKWRADPGRRERLRQVLEDMTEEPPADESAEDRMERLYRRYRREQGKRQVLDGLLESWDQADSG